MPGFWSQGDLGLRDLGRLPRSVPGFGGIGGLELIGLVASGPNGFEALR